MKTGPDYIQLYPLLRCNRSCSFCFNHTMPFMEDIELIDFRTMLDRIREWPVTTIDLMGGEPTLHHDMPELLREAGRRGLRVNFIEKLPDDCSMDEIMMESRCGGCTFSAPMPRASLQRTVTSISPSF